MEMMRCEMSCEGTMGVVIIVDVAAMYCECTVDVSYAEISTLVIR
jgi:hypothetical protein